MSALNIKTVKPEQAVYTLVVGLGKTGLSVVRYLRTLGEAVIVVDSRDVPPGLNVLKNEYSDVECHTGKFDTALFVNAHRIVLSPGVSLAEPVLVEARKNNIEIIGDIDLFAHEVMAPVVGITGSNGKSTVTTLLALMATQAGKNAVASGNIGTPVLDSLADNVDLYVLELSSFQLETLQYLPKKAAVVLNISADHLDRYENLSAYAMSKQVIYEN
ncbi:MAG: UDP-N-acetylmuramoyl-L-alanine--D-glutamate ligase, partial [Gammaproteobacteria bacterium]|nr:UDP-N-acetylmuramoyl-L-alanine--D-glutamate ligase [Gammaproteobacteria bacterium]